MATWEELEAKAAQVGEQVRTLKAAGDKEALDGALKELLEVRRIIEAAR